MLSLYSQALFKRANLPALTQFKPPALPQRIYSQTLKSDAAHYKRYCEVVDWHAEEQTHPCYLQVLALDLQLKCLLDKKSPFAAMGLVHIDNTITVHHGVDLARPLDLRVRFNSVRQHHRGWLVTIEVQVFQNDQCVQEATSGYLAKVRAAHVGQQSRTPQSSEPEVSGDVVGELNADAGIGRRYARVSGDINPIHLSKLTGKLFGFDAAIAHGMWSLADAVSNIVAEQQNHGAPARVTQLRCDFHKPLLLPATADVYLDKAVTEDNFGVAKDDRVYLTGSIALDD